MPAAGPATGLAGAGTLDVGSGAYFRALQGGGATGFSLLLQGNGGAIAPGIVPRLDVLRIR